MLPAKPSAVTGYLSYLEHKERCTVCTKAIYIRRCFCNATGLEKHYLYLSTNLLTIVITLPFVMEGFVDKPHRDAKAFHVCTTGRTQVLLRHLHKRPGAKPLKHTPENPAALFYCSREADKF